MTEYNLDKLLDSIGIDLTEQSGREFEHVHVESDILAVVAAIVASVHHRKFLVESSLTQVKQRIFRHEYFIGQGRNGGTTVWPFLNDTALYQDISSRLGCRVHWVSVYEDLRCWAYMKFESGICIERILDPERMWCSLTWTGNDMLGTGLRQFDGLDDFLDGLKRKYVPADVTWNYALLKKVQAGENEPRFEKNIPIRFFDAFYSRDWRWSALQWRVEYVGTHFNPRRCEVTEKKRHWNSLK